MSLLWKQTLGELKKTFTRKEGKLNAKLGVTLIVVTAILLFVVLGFLTQMMGGGATSTRTVTKGECIQLIDMFQTELASCEFLADTSMYAQQREQYLLQAQACRDNIAVLEYVLDNNVDTTTHTIALSTVYYTGAYMGRQSWAFENLTINQSLLMTINTFLLVYAVLVACTAFGDDYKKRTIRMLALRPVTRSRILWIKTLAVTIHLSIATLAVYLLQIILTALSVGLDYSTVIIGMSGFAMVLHPVVYLPWIFVNQLITVLFYVTLCMVMCTLAKSKIIPLVVGIVLTQLGQGLTQLAQMEGQRSILWTFFPHTDLNQYLSFGTTFAGMNYFISLFVLVVYGALFTLFSHYVFRGRDVA